jgi:hypothetical protein
MATYTIWRTFDPNLSDLDAEMMMVRAVSTGWLEPRFRWLRSFDIEAPGLPQGFCVYEGPTIHDLDWQQRFCWLPVDEIREVQELCGPSCGGSGMDEPPAGSTPFFVERRFGAGVGAEDLRELNSAQPREAGVTWFRSFWDPERMSSKCIFAAESEQRLRDATTGTAGTVTRIASAVLGHPAQMAETYDLMGLPRHWEVAESADSCR